MIIFYALCKLHEIILKKSIFDQLFHCTWFPGKNLQLPSYRKVKLSDKSVQNVPYNDKISEYLLCVICCKKQFSGSLLIKIVTQVIGLIFSLNMKMYSPFCHYNFLTSNKSIFHVFLQIFIETSHQPGENQEPKSLCDPAEVTLIGGEPGTQPPTTFYPSYPCEPAEDVLAGAEPGIQAPLKASRSHTGQGRSTKPHPHPRI